MPYKEFWERQHGKHPKVRVFPFDKWRTEGNGEEELGPKLKRDWEKDNRRVEIEIIPKFNDLVDAYNKG